MDPIVERLRAELREFSSYPAGVVLVREYLDGLGFFPGGCGLWCDGQGAFASLRAGGVMVLGHNLDSGAGYGRSLKSGSENRNGSTWRSLVELLEKARIPLERCFFTNAYMGLKAQGGATGEFPGRRSPSFVEGCRAFLARQVHLVQPAVIATLGNWVPEVLCPLSASLKEWMGARRVVELDERGVGLVRGAAFDGVEHGVDVVALTHPDRRHLNVGRRRWKDLSGEAAEAAMLVEAWRGRN